MKLTDKKRKDIIDAAVEEFRHHGFQGARTTRIAKAAQVSSRTLYNHFPTKEALFDEIVELVLAEAAAIQPVPFDPSRPVRGQLLAALRGYLAVITDDRHMGLNRMAMAECLRDRDLAQRVFARAELSNNPVQAMVTGAMDAGQLRPVDPRYVTELLTAGAKSFFFWPQLLIGDTRGAEIDGVLEDSVDMIIMKFGADRPTKEIPE